jgi:hypothetical protein
MEITLKMEISKPITDNFLRIIPSTFELILTF